MLFGDVAHQLHLFSGQNGAGGVAGVGEHDGAGVLVDQRLDLLAGCEFVAFLRGAGDGPDGTAGEVHKGVVVGVEGFRNDDLIAVVQDAGQSHHQSLAARGGDLNLALLQRNADLLIVVLNRIDHHGKSGGGSICQNGIVDGTDGFHHLFRSLDIRLTDVQMVDLDPLCLCLIGQRSELTDR